MSYFSAVTSQSEMTGFLKIRSTKKSAKIRTRNLAKKRDNKLCCDRTSGIHTTDELY
jgi:hypothetical protein